MSALQEQLGRMVGPLPLGAWVVIVGGGLGFAYYSSRNREPAPEPEIQRDTSVDPGVGMGGSGQWIDLTVPNRSTVNDQPPIVTNDDWSRAALNYLISQGSDPAMASQAIGMYVQGILSTADIQKWALVRIALTKLGSPPLPIVSTGGAPNTPSTGAPATPRPAPTAPSTREKTVFHVVRPGDTVNSIAKRYNTTAWDIFGLNNSTGDARGAMTSRDKVVVGSTLRLYSGRKSKAPVVSSAPKPTRPVVPAKPKPKPSTAEYYTVKRGENLTVIARRYRTTWQKLYSLNRGTISNPNNIQAGAKIRVK